MDLVQRYLFGSGDLDSYSFADVRELQVAAGLECRRCHKFAALDLDELERKCGVETLGALKRRARCQRCGGRDPVILIRSPAMRGDRAWFPRPPGLTR